MFSSVSSIKMKVCNIVFVFSHRVNYCVFVRCEESTGCDDEI